MLQHHPVEIVIAFQHILNFIAHVLMRRFTIATEVQRLNGLSFKRSGIFIDLVDVPSLRRGQKFNARVSFANADHGQIFDLDKDLDAKTMRFVDDS